MKVPGTVDEYVVALEEKLCHGRFSSVTCAEEGITAKKSIGKGF